VEDAIADAVAGGTGDLLGKGSGNFAAGWDPSPVGIRHEDAAARVMGKDSHFLRGHTAHRPG